MKLTERLKQDNYLDLLGIVFGIIAGVIIGINVNIILGIIAFILITLLTAQIIRQLIVVYITKVNYKIITKEEKLNPEEVKEMSKGLHDIIELDKELTKFLDENSSGKQTDFLEKKLNKKWPEKKDYFLEKADDIFSKMNNLDLLLAIASTDEIAQIVDIFSYFKEITPDIEIMKAHPNELIPYYLKILSDKETFMLLSINGYYYLEVKNKIKFEEIEKFILQNMSNEELMILAQESKIWLDKLYYYGFLKKETNKKIN